MGVSYGGLMGASKSFFLGGILKRSQVFSVCVLGCGLEKEVTLINTGPKLPFFLFHPLHLVQSRH